MQDDLLLTVFLGRGNRRIIPEFLWPQVPWSVCAFGRFQQVFILLPWGFDPSPSFTIPSLHLGFGVLLAVLTKIPIKSKPKEVMCVFVLFLLQEMAECLALVLEEALPHSSISKHFSHLLSFFNYFYSVLGGFLRDNLSLKSPVFYLPPVSYPLPRQGGSAHTLVIHLFSCIFYSNVSSLCAWMAHSRPSIYICCMNFWQLFSSTELELLFWNLMEKTSLRI